MSNDRTEVRNKDGSLKYVLKEDASGLTRIEDGRGGFLGTHKDGQTRDRLGNVQSRGPADPSSLDAESD